MVALSRLVSLAALLDLAGTASGLRKSSDKAVARLIAGVPVLNYELAFQGLESSQEQQEHWLVFAKKGISEERLNELCWSGACERVGHPSKRGVPYFEVRASENELGRLLSAAADELDFVEPHQEMHLIDDEEMVDEQLVDSDRAGGSPTTFMEGSPTTFSANWGLSRVGAPEAPSGARQGSGVHVYVFDTGVRASHVEFAGRVVPSIVLTSGSLVECAPGDASCAGDNMGHGSHCAGIAAGSNVGVASQATIHAVKVMTDGGNGDTSWTYDALDWLASTGRRPAVASISLTWSGRMRGMQVAVDAAVAAGVTVVVAAGNQNSNACDYTPAFVSSAVTVGSVTVQDQRSDFSNFGACVDIWAPGSSITSAAYQSDTGMATHSGTSMACPHVAGGAALILAANPFMSPEQVSESLKKTAEIGAIGDLFSGDANRLLWVGNGLAPEPSPTPAPPPQCPSFADSIKPDKDGDCKCEGRKVCTIGGRTRDCPTSGGVGVWGGRYFAATCSDCQCVSQNSLR